MQISDSQTQFSMLKIILVFLDFFIEEYQFSKLQFDLESTLIYQKILFSTK